MIEMNREIKFRGKSIRTRNWLYGDLMHDNIGGRYVYPIESENLYKKNKVFPYTIGQCTLLKDKHGVEIYEGDILYDKEGAQYGIVKWNTLSFELGVRHMDCYDNIVCEVVGNIYDNPELAETILKPKEIGELIREEKK